MQKAFIYAIGCENGPVKIGISNSPQGRLSGIQTSCPFKVTILHSREVGSRDEALMHERMVHEVYAGARLMGEWFNFDRETAVEAIETAIHTHEHFLQRAV